MAADPWAVEIKRRERWVARNAAAIKVVLLYDLTTGQEVSRFKKGEWV